MVRAAWSRNARAPDPHWTVQATISEWTTQQGMRITRQRKKDWFSQEHTEFVGIHEQHTEDVAAAHRNRKEKQGTQWISYEDGATRTAEDKVGWGI